MKLQFNKMDREKSKEELVELLYQSRIANTALEAALNRERSKVDNLIASIMPVINQIKEAKGIFRVFAIAKYALVLADIIYSFVQSNKSTNESK